MAKQNLAPLNDRFVIQQQLDHAPATERSGLSFNVARTVTLRQFCARLTSPFRNNTSNATSPTLSHVNGLSLRSRGGGWKGRRRLQSGCSGVATQSRMK